MNSYWVQFKERRALCGDAESVEAAMRGAAAIGTVVSARVLPYPASPRFNNLVNCPSFCYSPETCQGRSSCPKNHVCSE